MRKILLPVDDSKGARVSVQACIRLLGSRSSASVLLLHVLQPGGKSLLHDRSSDPEMATLREQLEASGKMDDLEQAAQEILGVHQKILQKGRFSRIRTLTRFGDAAEEIIKAAAEEKVDMIIIGSSRTLLQKLLMGDVAREVANKAKVSVLIAR